VKDATHYAQPGVSASFGAESCPSNPSLWTAPVPFNAAVPVAGEPIAVFVNEARWIVQCPDCKSAQLACKTDPRFMCHECANVRNGGQWRPTLWPKSVDKVEVALGKRLPVNQNWLPSETVADMVAENVAYGIA